MSNQLASLCEAIVDCEHKTAPEGDGFALSVGTKAMKNGRLVLEACKPVSEETYESWSRRLRPEPGDLILAREAPVGDVIRVPESPIVCLGQRTVLIRPDADKVHPRFLHYWLLGPDAQGPMLAQTGGATVGHLNVGDIRKLDVTALPSSQAHQRQVADLLGAIDDLIENNRRRVQVLEEMVRAIYREWFVKFRYPGHETVTLVDSTLGPIPSGWEAGVVGDLLQLQRGYDLPLKSRLPGDVPVVGASGIQGAHAVAKVSGPGITTGRSGTIGVVNYLADDFWPLNTSLWVKEFKRATPRYAFFALSGVELRHAASGAAVPTLDRKVVHGIPIVCPPRALVDAWDIAAEPMFEDREVLSQENDRLVSLRDLLLPKLVTGQIDVSELNLDALRNGEEEMVA